MGLGRKEGVRSLRSLTMRVEDLGKSKSEMLGQYGFNRQILKSYQDFKEDLLL